MKQKKIVYMLLIVVGFFISWRSLNYFTDATPPSISLSGLHNSGYHKGNVSCLLKGEDSYNVSHIRVLLDNKPLVHTFRINARAFEHPFIIPTHNLPNGQHNLTIEAVDSSYAQNKTKKSFVFNVDNTPLQAAIVKPNDVEKVFQGRTLHVQVQANKPLKNIMLDILSEKYPCFPESKNARIYECYVPVDCEEKPNEYIYTVNVEDEAGNKVTLENKFQVVMYPFKKQVLAINAEKREHEKESGLPQKELESQLALLCKESAGEKLWNGNFYAPVDISRVTTEFGTVRTTQEKGRYMHKAVDVINMPKTVVWAPQRGKVVVKDRFVESGNTVVLDHGHGIFSLLFHLDSFSDINVGDIIRQGNPVGTLGKTGYATGYHLHWEMRLNNTHVDPLQWVKPAF